MDAYIGEIRIFCGNFAPLNWMFCEGQLLPIQQNTKLFSVIGTMYGGNGTVTFALPDLRGSVPISQGTGPGLTPRTVGEIGGTPTVALTQNEMPAHTHRALGYPHTGSVNSPANAAWAQYATTARPPVTTNLYSKTGDVKMAPGELGVAGQNLPHNNMQPYLAMRFIICVEGIFPPRA
jgi:microcystin-dependent protein